MIILYRMKQIKNIVFIILGNFILAIGIGCFVLPFNILSGGVAGIAVLLKPFVTINEEIIVIILDILFFVMGSIFLGKKFALNTIVSAISYPICLIIVDHYIPSFSVEPLVAALYGGLIGGIGIGICMKNGGSTGGTDVPPLIFEKYFGLDVSKCVMIFDAITVILGLWIYDIEAVLIGLICVFFDSFAIEKVMSFYDGRSISKRIEIISDKYQEIISDIHIELERGTTIISGKGGYTDDQKCVILCIVPQKDYQSVIDIVDRHDKKAFVVVSETYDVHGEGFTFEGRL